MTDQEMRKMIEDLKNDPEVGDQVRELLLRASVQQAARTPPERETKLDIDPRLVRQARQLIALHGGGTFGEQLEANVNNGCAGIVTIVLFFAALAAIIAVIGFVAQIAASMGH